MPIPTPTALLQALLAEPLPRGNRCGDCVYWQPIDPGRGECAQGVPDRGYPGLTYCFEHDGCYEWFTRFIPLWYEEA